MNYEPDTPKRYFGLDLGQSKDYSALALVTDETKLDEFDYVDEPANKFPSALKLDFLHRFERGTPYPEIVRQVQELLIRKPLDEEKRATKFLSIDATGVGRPVVDMFKETDQLANLLPVTITGGDAESNENNHYRVPKRNLVSIVQVALQSNYLKVPRTLPFAQVLSQELANFRVKISLDTGHDSYGAWRESDHDDLVLAVSLALWARDREEKRRVIIINQERRMFEQMSGMSEWNRKYSRTGY